MFDLQEFLQGLDFLYASGRAKEAESYLKQGLKNAAAEKDDGAILAILNELMGYYRAASRYEECILCSQQALSLADAMGLSGTADYGTMLLNAATGYRAAGKFEKAERLYEETYRIFRKHMTGPDYRMASLHNNMSLLYSETGRLEDAKKELELAMDTIAKLPDADIETAITHTNLGNLCFQMNRFSEGAEHMKKAVSIFERMPDGKDSHYASALSGLAEAYYHEGELEESARCYEKALREIEAYYGENDYYRITKRNLETVRDLLKREKAAAASEMTGLEMAKAYYEAYGKKMIEEKFPDYKGRIAVGLVGEGSECLGFDDAVSADHDYGPGFCIWLTKKDYRKIGKRLQEEYEKLPGEFMGFPAKHRTERGKERTGVFEIGSFFQHLTGYAKAPKTEEEWYSISEEALRTATSGEIFSDPLGKFTKRRARFLNRPDTVSLEKLAVSLGKMAQAGQYNFGRAKKREDVGAMYFAMAEFLKAACEAVYLLNGTYMPFYKWRMRGMRSLKKGQKIRKQIEELMNGQMAGQGVEEKAEEQMEAICQLIVQELKESGLTKSDDPFLEIQKAEVRRTADIRRMEKEEEQWKEKSE